jgi:AraC-like DNA-binding protein
VEPAHRAADGGSGRLTAQLGYRYRERAPHPGLAEHVACVWSGAAHTGMRILPDGCIDIVWIGDAALTVAGPDTAGNVVGLPDGTLTVGVRFRSGRAPGFLRADARELTDRSITLEDVWGTHARRLTANLATAPTVEAKQAILEAALLARLDDTDPPHPDVAAAIDLIAASPSTARVADLSKELNVSERHLRRGFERAIGYGPKTFGRVLRFRNFLDLAETHGHPLGQAAAEAGYADQPHLTRESNDLAGLPPAELIAVRDVQDG